MKAQYERWPAEYKFAVDQDVVVLFAYPSPFIDWAGFAFINHIPSVSSVTLGKPVSIVRADGTVVPAWPDREETVFGERLFVWRSYNSEEGKARLEAALADAELMPRILEDLQQSHPHPCQQPRRESCWGHAQGPGQALKYALNGVRRRTRWTR